MDDKIRNCIDQATRARRKALACGDSEQKVGWMLMATVWDAIASEYKSMVGEYEILERARKLGCSTGEAVVRVADETDPAEGQQA